MKTIEKYKVRVKGGKKHLEPIPNVQSGRTGENKAKFDDGYDFAFKKGKYANTAKQIEEERKKARIRTCRGLYDMAQGTYTYSGKIKFEEIRKNILDAMEKESVNKNWNRKSKTNQSHTIRTKT